MSKQSESKKNNEAQKTLETGSLELKFNVSVGSHIFHFRTIGLNLTDSVIIAEYFVNNSRDVQPYDKYCQDNAIINTTEAKIFFKDFAVFCDSEPVRVHLNGAVKGKGCRLKAIDLTSHVSKDIISKLREYRKVKLMAKYAHKDLAKLNPLNPQTQKPQTQKQPEQKQTKAQIREREIIQEKLERHKRDAPKIQNMIEALKPNNFDFENPELIYLISKFRVTLQELIKGDNADLGYISEKLHYMKNAYKCIIHELGGYA